MNNQQKAAELAQNGFELIRVKKFHEAEKIYIEVIELTDPSHWTTQDYHGEFALVLDALGKNNEADLQREKSLESAMLTSENHTDLEVTLARHFLAESFIKNNKCKDALQLLEPFLNIGCAKEWLLFVSKAKALFSLGQKNDAKLIANTAINLAPNESLENIKENLAFILNE